MATFRATFHIFNKLHAFGLLLIAGIVVSGCTSSSTTTSPVENIGTASVTRNGEIYLFRGLANVFSLGIDEIGEKMQARGLNARVQNHSAWRATADDIIKRSRAGRISYPVIIMGHSLGGNATMQMAKYLGDNGVKVAYAVSFDPTITTFVGKNVGDVINFYLPNSEHSNIVKAEPSHHGSLRNFDVSQIEGITHVTVEKYPKFQSQVINKTLSLTKKRSTTRTWQQEADHSQR